MDKRHKNLTERGSALFLVFVGVALFAALSLVVAGMMRSGDPAIITEQKSQLFADEILAYARDLRQAVQNMRISNGCTDTDISFENPVVAGYTNGANDACKVFNSSGGDLTYMKPPSDWLDLTQSAQTLYGNWYFPAGVCVYDVGNGNAGCDSDTIDNEEIIVVIPYIKKQICVKINKALGVTNPSDNPPQDTADMWDGAEPKFVGAFADGKVINSTQSRGKLGACLEGATNPASGTYHFYQVLWPR